MLIDKTDKILFRAAKKMKTLQFAMNIPALGVDYSYSSTTPSQRFHSASVGKMMTATLIIMAIERGKVRLDTRIHTILEPGVLDRLFVYEGKDYRNEITVQHLMGHLSGINDYFESKTMDGSLFIDDAIKNHEEFWTPATLLDFTRNRQRAIASPGKKFFYSDSGYVLLGLIVEALYEMPFHQVLESFLFKPSGMKETTLCFYGEGFDQQALAPLYINGVDVHLFTSISCDFSGGGLSTTANDLLIFLDYLQKNRYFSKESLGMMTSFDHRYRQGIYYGLGMMQLRFGEFFFLLKSLPRLQGHLGVTGVHAWYDPTSKATFVMNVGNTEDMASSFRVLISILQLVQKAVHKKN